MPLPPPAATPSCRSAGFNTAVLFTSSFSMALAVQAAHCNGAAYRALIGWLSLTVTLGIAFLCIKGVEYRFDYLEHLVRASIFDIRGPAATRWSCFSTCISSSRASTHCTC